jgi:hypothetical protein
MMFQRNILPPFSGLKLAACLFGLCFNPEYAGRVFLRKDGELLPDYMMSNPRIQYTSQSLP